MRTFISFFILEFKRFFGKRNIIIILLLLFFSLVFIQSGINEYKSILNRKDKFQEYERTKVSEYINYSLYGGYGIRMLFVPAPISAFFTNSGVLSETTSYIDSGERLKIYKQLKGKNIFDLKKFGFTDFSGIILFFGSLLALFYGYETFSSSEYLKFLSTISTKFKVFYSMLVARILMMLLLFLVITGSAYMLIRLNDLAVPLDKYVFAFALSLFLVLLAFFSLGTIIGTMKSRVTGIIALLSCWFVLLYFVPTAVNTYIAGRADLITPLYQLEMDKLKVLMGFEKKALEKAGKAKQGPKADDSERERVSNYWNNEFVNIQGLEENMQKQMEANISLSHKLSMFFPSTFYFSVTNEISSRGYENLIDFYTRVRKLKHDFVRFYIDKSYFSNFTEVESFVKKDENVFSAQSRLPRNFIAGVSVNFFYVLGLCWLTFYRFNRSLFMLCKNEAPNSKPRNMKMKKGQLKIMVSEGELFKNQLFNLCSGEIKEFARKGFSGKISIDDVDITVEKNREDFLYLCHPEDIPGDIIASDFLAFTRRLTRGEKNGRNTKAVIKKKFSKLKHHEKGGIMLAALGMIRSPIYLIHDIARGMPIEFTVQLKKTMDALKEEGTLVLYLTPDELINIQSIKKGQKVYESTTWCQLVDHYKGLLDIK